MAVHFASVSYINSSLLTQFVNNSTLSVLYITGSFLAIILLLLVPFILRKVGSIFTFLIFVFLEILAVFGLGSVSIAILVVFIFLVHLMADPILYFCLDVNLEQETKKEGETGGKRGIILSISNLAWVLSPLTLTFLVNQNSFSKVYYLSGIALVPLFFIIVLFFKNTKQAAVLNSNIFMTLQSLRHGGDKTRIIMAQFILNFFYAWMIIYLPLLLNKEIGFSWREIGFLFPIMLLPFLLFEMPTGFLADKKYGEREFLILGFIIMVLSTLLIPSLSTKTFWLWAIVLFTTRVGASLVESSSESYFFKHVKEDDTGLISLFRAVRPLALIIAPLVALPIVYYLSYSASFLFLAIFTTLGLFFIPKVDTK